MHKLVFFFLVQQLQEVGDWTIDLLDWLVNLFNISLNINHHLKFFFFIVRLVDRILHI